MYIFSNNQDLYIFSNYGKEYSFERNILRDMFREAILTNRYILESYLDAENLPDNDNHRTSIIQIVISNNY